MIEFNITKLIDGKEMSGTDMEYQSSLRDKYKEFFDNGDKQLFFDCFSKYLHNYIIDGNSKAINIGDVSKWIGIDKVKNEFVSIAEFLDLCKKINSSESIETYNNYMRLEEITSDIQKTFIKYAFSPENMRKHRL